MKVNGNHSCDWTCFSKYMSVIFKADDFSMIQKSFDNLNKAEITIDPNIQMKNMKKEFTEQLTEIRLKN